MASATVAIASGKGGTGKTTLAVNLAASCKDAVTLIDCDVEEPNADLFLSVSWQEARKFSVPTPTLDASLCSGCGECKDHCRFKAIAMVGDQPMIFPELCHSCGACVLACPSAALSETAREIGTIRRGQASQIQIISGQLNVGEAKSPPLIAGVRGMAGDGLTIVDAPPGTSCPAIAAVKDVDYLMLVTEPTPFGLSDLALAIEMARALSLRCGVVINRSEGHSLKAEELCAASDVPVLHRFSYDTEIAKAYSSGRLIVDAVPRYRTEFCTLMDRVWEEIRV